MTSKLAPSPPVTYSWPSGRTPDRRRRGSGTAGTSREEVDAACPDRHVRRRVDRVAVEAALTVQPSARRVRRVVSSRCSPVPVADTADAGVRRSVRAVDVVDVQVRPAVEEVGIDGEAQQAAIPEVDARGRWMSRTVGRASSPTESYSKTMPPFSATNARPSDANRTVVGWSRPGPDREVREVGIDEVRTRSLGGRGRQDLRDGTDHERRRRQAGPPWPCGRRERLGTPEVRQRSAISTDKNPLNVLWVREVVIVPIRVGERHSQ